MPSSITASGQLYPSSAAEPVIKPQGLPEETRIRYTEILAEHFGEDGYQTGRPIFRGRFRRFYAEKYGCPPAETDDRIDEIMSMVGTKRDNRVFPKQDDSQNNLIMEIVSDILSAFDSGATAVYIEAVYDKYQQIVAKENPVIYLYAPANIIAIRKKFKNIYPTNLGGILHNIEEVYIK